MTNQDKKLIADAFGAIFSLIFRICVTVLIWRSYSWWLAIAYFDLASNANYSAAKLRKDA